MSERCRLPLTKPLVYLRVDDDDLSATPAPDAFELRRVTHDHSCCAQLLQNILRLFANTIRFTVECVASVPQWA